MKSLSARALAFAVIVTIRTEAAWSANYVFVNVVDTTSSAPVGVFEGFRPGGLAIDDGVVSFTGDYNTQGFAHDSGVFVGNGGTIVTLAKTGDVAPLGSFSAFTRTAASSGVTAFAADYRDDQNFQNFGSGVFLVSNGAPQAIVKTGDSIPAGEVISTRGFSYSDGVTAYIASTLMQNGNEFTTGVFTTSGGSTVPIAKTGDPAPSGVLEIEPDLVANSGPHVAFLASWNGLNDSGLFVGDGGPLVTIVKDGDAAPLGTFSKVRSSIVFSIDGAIVAFNSEYSQGPNSYRGIFTGSGGPLTTIAKTGDAAPIGSFTLFGNPSIAAGRIAFRGDYDDKVNDGISYFGLFVSEGGTLKELLALGDPLFGSTVTFIDLIEAIDRQGNVGFIYNLADGRAGIAVAHVVPEPSVAALIGVGAIAFARGRRRCGYVYRVVERA